MSFYPMFNIRESFGFVRLPNFSPNNWEPAPLGSKRVYAYRTDGVRWLVTDEGAARENAFRSFDTETFPSLGAQDVDGTRVQELVLLQLRTDTVPSELSELPPAGPPSTHWPEWRATIGFRSERSRVSYQGEINPTPPKASLLSFHPFIQFGDVRNFFVFVNVERTPAFRWAEMEIFLSASGRRVDVKKVRSNAANVIPLDGYGFTEQDLPVFHCGRMTGIPFGFGVGVATGMLSLEHTHPPGSLTLHGDRMLAQRDIKSAWVNRFVGLAQGNGP
jgi:hypothetical protein